MNKNKNKTCLLRCFILGVRFLFIFGEFINCDHNHVIKTHLLSKWFKTTVIIVGNIEKRSQ
jgi:hypothetical protein